MRPPAHREGVRSDAELIRAARVDAEALGELYRRHARSIARWFAARTPARMAGELTAETFAQASLSLHRFRDEADGSAAPWLYGIARNVLRRTLERARVETGAYAEVASSLGCSQVAARIRVTRALDSLSRLLRGVVT
jgi:DNA-directed RNA polymerase specialized sigma24 family protein